MCWRHAPAVYFDTCVTHAPVVIGNFRLQASGAELTYVRAADWASDSAWIEAGSTSRPGVKPFKARAVQCLLREKSACIQGSAYKSSFLHI